VRKSTKFFLFTTGELALFGLCLLHAAFERSAQAPALLRKQQVVRSLQLTDLALFTEARYTRHLSQADLHAPFQDHPVAFEHFPSGSVAGAPRRPAAGTGAAP
jgi:hypothetical protein